MKPTIRPSHPSQVLQLFRQLETLAASGHTISGALAVVIADGPGGPLESRLALVHAWVETGSPLSEALAPYPELCDPMSLGLLRIGETRGREREALGAVTRYLEEKAERAGLLRQAALCPLILGLLGTLALFFLLEYVIPPYQELWKSMNVTLPITTQIVFAASAGVVAAFRWLAAGGWIPVLLAVLVAGRIRLGSRLLHGLAALAERRRSGPLARFWNIYFEMWLTRELSRLLEAGASTSEALDTLAEAAPWETWKVSLLLARADTALERTLPEALRRTGRLSPGLLELLEAGDEHGRSRELLRASARLRDERLRRWIARAALLVQPLIIVGLGTALGILVLGTFMPPLGLINNVG